jgi:hypothetical protein
MFSFWKVSVRELQADIVTEHVHILASTISDQ